MSAPVIFYMFLNVFAPVVISDSYITTIVFNEPITRPQLGVSANEIYIEKSANSKMLFIRGMGKQLNTNLNVPTKSGNFYSFLIKTGEKPHSIIRVEDGKKSSDYKEVNKSKTVIIEESKYIAKASNISKKSISVNSILLRSGGVIELPKGAPIFINNERVHR